MIKAYLQFYLDAEDSFEDELDQEWKYFNTKPAKV